MSSGGGAPPPAPGLSQEERDLLAKQGLTLDQFHNILQQSTSDSTDNQNILRQLSGLYKQVTTPASVKKGNMVTRTVADTDKINGYLNILANNRRVQTFNDNGKLYTKDDLQRALTDVGYANSIGLSKQTQEGSPDVTVPESTSWQLDQSALDDLKARVATATGQQQQIADLQNKRYINALQGNAPVSQGLIQRKLDDFKALKEGAAKRGILIEGDSPESATSQSSAGNELMGQFNRTYGLLADSERNATLATGAPDSTGTYGTPVSMATSSTATGPASLLSGYSSLGSSYGSAMQPYGNQRMLGYNSQLAGYTSGKQTQAGLTGLLGTGGGLAMMAGGPWGYGIGAGLMGLGMLNSYQ